MSKLENIAFSYINREKSEGGERWVTGAMGGGFRKRRQWGKDEGRAQEGDIVAA